MDLTEILRRCRNRLEDNEVPPKWNNQELVDYINQVERDICIKTNCLIDASTTSVCQIAITNGTSVYDLHSSILIVYSVWYGTDNIVLTQDEVVPYFNFHYTNWQTETGVPYCFFLDFTARKIKLYPIPNADSTLKLRVSRIPIIPFTISDTPTILELAKTPEIPQQYHDYMFNGIFAKCYMKDDEDTFDNKKAQYYEQLYAADINHIAIGEIQHHYTNQYVGLSRAFV